MITALRKSKNIVQSGSYGFPGEQVTLTLGGGGGGGTFPLSVSANGRYFVTAGGQPFLMIADSSQAACTASVADVQLYASSRAAAGFNCIQFNLIADGYPGGPDDNNWSTEDGVAPFTGAKFTTPNPTYWSRMDTVINYMGGLGMFVLLNPAATGGTIGSAISGASTATLQTYGDFLANRYKSFSFVGWYFGNDYTPGSFDTNMETLMQRFINIAPTQIRAGQLSFSSVNTGFGNTTAFDDGPRKFATYLSCNTAYIYGDPAAGCLLAYNNPTVNYSGQGIGTNTTPPVPVLMCEDTYEWEQNAHDPGLPAYLLSEMWWEYLSGAVARIHGGHFTAEGWLDTDLTSAPISGYVNTSPLWQHNLNSPAVIYIGYLKALLGAVTWWLLVPDQTNAIGTSGRGSGGSDGGTYVAMAAVADGSLAIAFLPAISGLTVAMTFFAGTVTAQWLDPTNGVYTAVSGSPFTNTGTHVFTPTGNNSAGGNDWVLILSTVTSVNLAGTTVFSQETNAGALVGAVTVTRTPAGTYLGQIILGGTDAAKFALTNGGFQPTNLVVGANNIPPGSYSITLTAN